MVSGRSPEINDKRRDVSCDKAPWLAGLWDHCRIDPDARESHAWNIRTSQSR